MDGAVKYRSHVSHVVYRKDWVKQLALPPVEIAWVK